MSSSSNRWWFASSIAPVVIGWGLAAGHGEITWLQGIAFCLVVASAATDGLLGKIPNYLTYPGVGWGLLINTFPRVAEWVLLVPDSNELRVGDVGAAGSLSGLTVCFAIMVLGYLMAGSGAGDVKLAAALGSLLGFRIALQCLLATFIIAGAVILVWLIWNRGPRAVWRALEGELLRFVISGYKPAHGDEERKLLEGSVPLGVFFALGTLLVLMSES